jgi:L-serine kinase (ADP)
MSPQKLKPHEAVHFGTLLKVIFSLLITREIKHPVLIDTKTCVILDGHHRARAAQLLGFQSIACKGYDYLNDSTIQVSQRRKEIPVSKDAVIRMGLSDAVFPQKTTRHIFRS